MLSDLRSCQLVSLLDCFYFLSLLLMFCFQSSGYGIRRLMYALALLFLPTVFLCVGESHLGYAKSST